MTNSKPVLDITVIAANFNNGRFLCEFFDSYLSSTVRVRQFIIVDDGSADNSREIIESYRAQVPEISAIFLPHNVGFGNALNAGIEQARCRYILRVDPDDVLLPERIERQYDALERLDADVIGSNAEIFRDETNETLGCTNFPLEHDAIKKTIEAGEHGVLHPTVMARATLFKNNPYQQRNVPAEDYDIFARMLLAGAKFKNLSQPLLRYRVHGKSASTLLPFSTIKRTYELRDELFHKNTSAIRVRSYYWHIKAYRKALFASSKVIRLSYLALAAFLRPKKIVRRVIRYMGI